jgi:hypothetical protein
MLQEESWFIPSRKKQSRNITQPRFFERSTPNQLWQGDIFTFRLGAIGSFLSLRRDNRSRMSREVHVRIREGVGVRLPALLDFVVLKRRLCPFFSHSAFFLPHFLPYFPSVFSLLTSRMNFPIFHLPIFMRIKVNPKPDPCPSGANEEKGFPKDGQQDPPGGVRFPFGGARRFRLF